MNQPLCRWIASIIVVTNDRIQRLYITPPWIIFPWSTSPQLEQDRCQKRRRWKHLVGGVPKTYRSVMAPSRLQNNRARKTAVRGPSYRVLYQSTTFIIVSLDVAVRNYPINHCCVYRWIIASTIVFRNYSTNHCCTVGLPQPQQLGTTQ